MSSPFRRSDHSRSSPSRQRVDAYHRVPRGSPNGDLSAHLIEDLRRVLIDDERELHKQLDERALEQQKLQYKALEEALAKHDANRKQAEDVLERHFIELEQERVRRAQEEAQRKEEARRKLEEERRKKEEQERQIAAQRERDEAQRVAELKKREEEEKARRKAAEEKEEAERKVREQSKAQEIAAKEAEAQRQEQARQQQQASSAQTNGILGPSSSSSAPPATASAAVGNLPNGVVTSVDERKQVNAAYLQIHQRLKELRSQADGGGNTSNAWKHRDPGLKNLSDWRHELRTRVNQISRTDKEGNKATVARIQQTLDRALPFAQSYSSDVSGFFFKNPKGGQPVQGNLVLLFMLNHFVKLFFGLIEREVHPLPPRERSQAADHVGNMAVQIFAAPKYWAEGSYSFIDILWAKYHKKLPLLFGVRAGAQDDLTIAWVSCFASITLRDFRNSRALPKNPAPARMYWEALARLLNTPTSKQTLVHYQILTGLLHETAIPRFIAFYGQIGVATLKHAVFEFPKTAPSNPQAQKEADAVRTLAAAFDNDLHLKL